MAVAALAGAASASWPSIWSPGGDVAFVMDDANPNFLFAVDLVSGDRMMFSK